MKSGHVLYISDYEVLLYQIRNKQVDLARRFAHQEDDYRAFGEYLQEQPLRGITLLVNSRHEEYRQERIPKLMGGDRQALLTHKRKRLFPATPYTAALLQGEATKQERSQERILFTCMAAPDLLQPWIKILLAARVAISGICSQPLLSQLLLKNLPQADQALLVTYTRRMGENTPYGLRQSFFLNQQLVASRLIPLHELGPRHFIAYALAEIFKTQQYLQGQGLASEERPFAVHLLLPQSLIAPLQEHLSTAKLPEYLNYYLLDLEQVIAVDGLEIGAAARDGEIAYFDSLMAWYALRYGKNHYAQAHETRYFTYQKARLALFAASLLVGLGCLAYGGTIFFEALKINEQAQKATLSTASVRKQYDEAQARQRQILDIPVDVIHIKNTVDVADYIEGLYRDPYNALGVLAKHLNDFPALALKSLTWEHKRVPVQKKSAASKLLNARALLRRKNTEQEMESIEILTVEGRLNGFQGNTIRAVRTLKYFVKLLQEEKGVTEVKTLDSPMNLASQSLSGTAGKDPAQAPFKLEIQFSFEE